MSNSAQEKKVLETRVEENRINWVSANPKYKGFSNFSNILDSATSIKFKEEMGSYISIKERNSRKF